MRAALLLALTFLVNACVSPTARRAEEERWQAHYAEVRQKREAGDVARAEEAAAAVARRREAYIAANSALPAGVVAHVRAGQVAVGMTADDARAAWGEPQEVNRTRTEAATREQWVYRGAYLYMLEGYVEAVQDTR